MIVIIVTMAEKRSHIVYSRTVTASARSSAVKVFTPPLPGCDYALKETFF